MEKIKSMNFMSLSQSEILGFGDEIVSVNVTKLKKYFYYLIGNTTEKTITGKENFSRYCYDGAD